jgi:subtilisin-like proprotein convertase family protein
LVISDLNLILDDLTHTCVSDLKVELTSPLGTTVAIIRSYYEGGILRGFGCPDDFLSTVLDDDAATNLRDGSAPYSGSFNIEHPSVVVNPLSQFDGENALGTWTLVIDDQGVWDTGSLNAWSLEFTGELAEVAPTSIEVSKTASFDGRFVSGTISISNVGEDLAYISAVADSLEAHVPGRVIPLPLPEGSTPNWFKIADVPVDQPGPIPAGETLDIDYSFDLCRAADFTGANSLRNVVAVTLANKPAKAKKDTVLTRSESFAPEGLQCPTAAEDLSPCLARDWWEFDVTPGQTVYIQADTADAATAADLCFSGYCEDVDFFGGDDNFTCTFPPPEYSCPEDTFVATVSGTCTFRVAVCSSACSDFKRANYDLTVEVDGVDAVLTLTADDLY